jgi:hypothetical protein
MPAIFSFVVVIPGINEILGITGILAASYSSQEKYPEHIYWSGRDIACCPLHRSTLYRNKSNPAKAAFFS